MSFSSAVERKNSIRDKYAKDSATKETRTKVVERMPKARENWNIYPFEQFLFNAPNDTNVVSIFREMWAENPRYALRMALWLRDARGGSGRRQSFREILNFLQDFDLEDPEKFAKAVPEVGRYDDLIYLAQGSLKEHVYRVLKRHLNDPNTSGLVAKWMPRDTSNKKDYKQFAIDFRKWLELTPKQYRKMLVGLTNAVETLMCENRWDEIEYETLPSQAAARYQNAFQRHSPKRYQEYLEQVEEGNFTIKADVLLPHEAYKAFSHGNEKAADLQWKALPDYGDKKLLPIIDVSGSMTWVAGAGGLQLLDIAVMLGIYFSEKNTSDLKDCYMTFSSHPTIEKMNANSSIASRYAHVVSSNWSGLTNLDKAFSSLLSFAYNNDLSDEDMPEYLVVISDMQFNGPAMHWDLDVMNRIKATYGNAGYTMPGIVWWNLNARETPVQPNMSNVYCVGGSSPEIIKSVLKGEIKTTADLVMDIVEGERYANLY